MEAERNSLALVGRRQGFLPVTRFGVFSYAWRYWGAAQFRLACCTAPLLVRPQSSSPLDSGPKQCVSHITAGPKNGVQDIKYSPRYSEKRGDCAGVGLNT